MYTSFITEFLILSIAIAPHAQVTLITADSNWKYFDQVNVLTPIWNALGFGNICWSSGNAKVRYGNDDEQPT